MMTVRSFICIELPDEVKSEIALFQARLKSEPASVSWTKPENIHLTLKFLGDVEEGRLTEIERTLESVAARFSPFELAASGCGVFPNERNPRVLWIGVREDEGHLQRLARAVEDAMAGLGFAREDRPFQAHLTIGRVRAAAGAHELARKLMAQSFPPRLFRADHLTLMRSDLRPSGAIYTPLDVIPLSRRTEDTR